MSARVEQLTMRFDEPLASHAVDPAPPIVAHPVGYPRFVRVQSWRSVDKHMANRYHARRHVYCGRCKREYCLRDRVCPHCGTPWNGERVRVSDLSTLRPHTRPNSDDQALAGTDAHGNEISD